MSEHDDTQRSELDFRKVRQLAGQGDAAAQRNLGDMYADGKGVAQDYGEAARWYRQAAEQGEAEAQNNLGVMYRTGRGVPQDDAEEVRWYRLAAEQGNARAQYHLGFMYRDGRGVPQDDAEAARRCRLAAAQGLAAAQFALGVMYRDGRGVPQDDAEAARWYRLAAEQGLDKAQVNLGDMYEHGNGVPQDNAEAVRWYRLAAEQGETSAQLVLARCYLGGTGVTQDYALAHVWSNLVAGSTQGDVRDEGARIRDQVEAYLSQQNILELQQRARLWTPGTNMDDVSRMQPTTGLGGVDIGGGGVIDTTAVDDGVLSSRSAMKQCPFCAEDIRTAAIICRHCGRQLTNAPRSTGDRAAQQGLGANKALVVYAGFWWRTMALLVDGMITSVPVIVLAFIGGVDLGVVPARPAVSDDIVAAVYVVSILTNWLYYTLCESSTQQATLGKLMLSLRVTDTHGRRIGFGQANGRYWSKILSGLLLGIGFLMVGFERKKQGLHDKIAGTLVLRPSSS